MTTVVALVRASHPEPAAAVTMLVVLLAIAWDAPVGTILLVGAAALGGQLSVGWSNDLIDRDRDRQSGRRDKPLVSGDLGPATVRAAIGVALAAAVVLSLLLGALAGGLHLALVAAGWAYNVGLKRTVLSWVPYAVCFGGLPVVVSLAVRDELPAGWMPVAGALLGTGAHLVNAVPDLEDDRRTGVVGLPHRLGARWALRAAGVLMLVGTAVTVVVPVRGLDVVAVVTLATCVALLVIGQLMPGQAAFRAVLGIALIDVIALLLRT